MDFMKWLYDTHRMSMYDYWASTAEYRRMLDLEYETGYHIVIIGTDS